MSLIVTFIAAGFFSAFGWWGAQQILPPHKDIPKIEANMNENT